MDSSRKPNAIVAGHLCLDITPMFPSDLSTDLSTVLAPGKLVAMDGIELSTGGAVSNTGIALSIMGVDTLLMGSVGDDAFGEIVRDLVGKYGDTSGVATIDGVGTSYTVVLVPPGTDRIFLHYRGSNDRFLASDIDYGLVEGSRLFHFGYPPLMAGMFEHDGRELVEIMRRIRQLGVTTSLDMAFPGLDSPAGRAPWRRILEETLPYTDIFLPSLEETLYMLDPARYAEINSTSGGKEILDVVDLSIVEDLAAELLALGVALAGIKCGKHGLFLSSAGTDRMARMGNATPLNISAWSDRRLFAPSLLVGDVRSATGAGDSSIAGFLAALLAGRSIERAADVACMAGANTTQVYDALSGVVTLSEMELLLDREGATQRSTPSGIPSSWRSVDGRRWEPA